MSSNNGQAEQDSREVSSVNLLRDDSDNDSDKTEDPMFPWKSTARNAKGPPSILSPVGERKKESPTTKTLRSFSQNMENLYEDSSDGVKNDGEDAAKGKNEYWNIATESQLPKAVSVDSGTNGTYNLPSRYSLDWDIHHIRILPPPKEAKQALGVVIVRGAFPGTDRVKSNANPHGFIKRVREGGRGARSGLRAGDWFLSSKNQESVPKMLATFDEIQVWSKEAFPHYSPIWVVRRKDVVKKAIAKTSRDEDYNVHKTHRKRAPLAAKRSEPQKPSVKATFGAVRNETNSTTPPPYCALCNYDDLPFWKAAKVYSKQRPKKKPRHHHSWCSKRENFDAIKVRPILARLFHGRDVLKCRACEMEYQLGRVISSDQMKRGTDDSSPQHTPECARYRAGLKAKEKRRLVAQHKAEESKTKARLSMKSQKQKRSASAKRGNEMFISHDCISNDDDSMNGSDDDQFEDGSIYQPPSRSRPRMEPFVLNERRTGERSSTNQKEYTGRLSKNEIDDRKVTRSIMDEELRLFDEIATSSGEDEKATSKEGERNVINKPLSSTDNLNDQCQRIKPRWIPLYDDPWGKEGYQTGDVLLFGPQKGMGHHETIEEFPMGPIRYRVHPFETESNYRNTHFTPEEGLSVVSLTRDAQGTMPWGFILIRDEFGHACLVESVDPNSPASSATYIGVPDANDNKCGLNPNDMIIAVNGKPIGGMSILGVQIEIELSAPTLMLAISRYKHAKEAARHYAKMERRMLDFLDKAARDERLMGWQEIGNGPILNNQPLSSSRQDSNDSFHTPKSTKCDTTTKKGQNDLSGDPKIISIEASTSGSKSDSNSFSQKIAGKATEQIDRTDTTNLCESDFDSKSSPRTLSSKREGSHQFEWGGNNFTDSCNNSEASDDENPEMGCVCGAMHSSLPETETFWIQCDICHTWYHVATKCIGFDSRQAAQANFLWRCQSCTGEPETKSARDDQRLELSKKELLEKDPKNQDSVENYKVENKLPDESARDEYVLYTEEKASFPTTATESTQHGDKTKKMMRVERTLRELQSYNGEGGYWKPSAAASSHSNQYLRKRKGKDAPDSSENEHRIASVPQNRQNMLAASNDTTPMQKGDDSLSPPRRKSSRLHNEQSDGILGNTTNDKGSKQESFEEGDTVIVESHAWAYVDNQGGIGIVVKSYEDEDGDRLYNVKYPALHRTERAIMAKYVKSYRFD